jgi:hypothetical protein
MESGCAPTFDLPGARATVFQALLKICADLNGLWAAAAKRSQSAFGAAAKHSVFQRLGPQAANWHAA